MEYSLEKTNILKVTSKPTRILKFVKVLVEAQELRVRFV